RGPRRAQATVRLISSGPDHSGDPTMGTILPIRSKASSLVPSWGSLSVALALLALVAVQAACGTSSSPPTSPAAAGTPAAPAPGTAEPAPAPADAASGGAPASASTLSAPAKEAADAALKAYEAAREDLASDRTEGLAQAA